MKKNNKSDSFMKDHLSILNPLLIFILMTVFCSISWAAAGQYIEVKTIPLKEVLKTSLDWHVTAYNIKETEGTTFTTTNIPAKICFWNDIRKKDELCSKAEESRSAFSQVKELSLIKLVKGKEPQFGILFVSTRYGAVEPVHLISIWAYKDKEARFENILTPLRLNSQGEFKFIYLRSRKEKAIFVTANRVWAGGEEMLYGPHKFKIDIYDCAENGSFKLIGEYITETKYQSFEDVHKIDVISHELKNIQKYLSVKK